MTPFGRPESPLARHYRRVHLHGYLHWEGAVRHLPLRIQRVHTAAGRILLATDGVSDFYTGRPQEFLLYTQAPAPWQLRLLQWLAGCVDGGEWLDWGQLQPLPDGLRAPGHAAVLLSPPFLEPAALEGLQHDDRTVQFVMVTPLDEALARLGRQRGAAALEAAMARAGSSFSADDAPA